MSTFSPGQTAAAGWAALFQRPGLFVGWTLLQLPVAAVFAGLFWVISHARGFGGRPEIFPLALFGAVAFMVLWRPLLRSVAIRAVLDPRPGAAFRLRWGRAETMILMLSFSRSGPAPWFESFLAGLVTAGSVLLVVAVHGAWPLTILVFFGAIIWLRVRSSLTFPLIVDGRLPTGDKRFNDWFPARRVGWELTGRHFWPLCLMETLTLGAWIGLSIALAVAAVLALGLGHLVAVSAAGISGGGWEAAFTNAVDRAGEQMSWIALGVLALWIAMVNALHMILCTIPTATAYLAIRPETEEVARKFA